MSSHTIYFDVETCALPDTFLDIVKPTFEAPANYKDEAKIKASILEQEARWKQRAALSPLTGKVLAIGILDLDGSYHTLDGGGDETKLLEEFRALVNHSKTDQLVGFNIHSFDLPFLMKRAWANGLAPCCRPGTNFSRQERMVDLRAIWQCGDRTAEGSLDTIAKFFGVGSKSGSGADFARLWTEDRDAAVAYLKNDLLLTMEVAERMGVAF